MQSQARPRTAATTALAATVAGVIVLASAFVTAHPAARVGDTTAHGGVIVAGLPSVLINGAPAARVSDMHTCPAITGMVPHVGGPILAPGASTVLIGGLPAARSADLASCAGPPDAVSSGSPNVNIGG